jgi:MoCo/4Fe-4S cofactor protein with predicted Tat translocation signal
MSKRIWQHPAVPANETTVSWLSSGQLHDTPEFRQWMDREFPQGAAELADGEDAETTRRSFLKLMGASTALAGLGMAACRRPEKYIVPFTHAPEWVIPGKATYYASAMPRAMGATPLVVTTFEGRPTKLGPNDLHPDSAGTDAFAQASILDLYAPNRSRVFLKGGRAADRASFQQFLSALSKDSSAKIGFVFGADDSPTRARLRKEIATKFAAARFYHYEPLAGESSCAYGDGARALTDFAKADRILSLDCDFAALDPQGTCKPFFARRKPEGADYTHEPDAESMNRLYVVESAYSMTGGMADHRLRATPSDILLVVAEVARQLGVALAEGVPPLSDERMLSWISPMVNDLRSHAGKSAVLVGSRQPAAVHHLAFAINRALGNVGEGSPIAILQTENTTLGSLADLKTDVESGAVETLVLLTPANPAYDAPSDLGFADLLKKCKHSIHLGLRTDATAHAVTWHVPAAHYLETWSDTRSARGVYTVVQPMILPLYPDCVTEVEFLLALLSDEGVLKNGEGEKGAASPSYHAVRATFAGLGGESEAAWKKLLCDGFFNGSSYPHIFPDTAARAREDIAAAASTKVDKDAIQLIFSTDSSVYDGRWIDNGWLQEAPDPISKLTWDNAALIAPKTAERLGIYQENQQIEPVTKALGVLPIEGKFSAVGPDGEGENRHQRMITVRYQGVTLELPVVISFGQAENTVVIPLGYGQGFDKHDELKRGPLNEAHVGLVGVNRGFNAYALRSSSSPYFALGAQVQKLEGKTYSLAFTQEHHAMYGRALARELSTHDAKDNKGNFPTQLANVKRQGNDSHAPPNISFYKPKGSSTWDPGPDGKAQNLLNDPLHQWGMSIDLSSCMGCSACTIACQAENNIPIIGKEQMAKGREMHWIRMDRYYAAQEYQVDHQGNRIKDKSTGEELKTPEWVRDNPAFVPQPVACVHCESAPCEVVCPVNATVHTEDGLNAMAYNRCIGTRYCANNCPYKARRFNFFDYNKRNPLIKHNLYKGPLGEKAVGEPDHLQKNPNVTVRMRGVMEKCTYCVQRLKDAVIRQKRGQKQESLVAGKASTEMQVTTDTLRVPVDAVKTACQEACPAQAITFGNLLDHKKSALGRSKEIARNYDLLNYIGTRPRTSYLARVKNPNPKMPDAPYIGKATIHMV